MCWLITGANRGQSLTTAQQVGCTGCSPDKLPLFREDLLVQLWQGVGRLGVVDTEVVQ